MHYGLDGDLQKTIQIAEKINAAVNFSPDALNRSKVNTQVKYERC
jgi:hypothetical protein